MPEANLKPLEAALALVIAGVGFIMFFDTGRIEALLIALFLLIVVGVKATQNK